MQSIEELKKELKDLNNTINSLGYWNAYAERLQRDYDDLLKKYNERIK